MTDLVVSEIFGPTLQGEGPTAGMPAVFVRLGRCNLSCAWCDTPYTWDWKGKIGPPQDPGALVRMDVDDVVSAVYQAPRVVVTGGEPTLQLAGLGLLYARLHLHDVPVEIETNGTRMPPPELINCQWNVSPKLAGSGQHPEARIVPDVLETFALWSRVPSLHTCFKFVIATQEDIDEVVQLQRRYDMQNVWVMPEGRNPVTVVAGLQALAPHAIEHGWRLSSRLHVLIWGDERGH